MKHIILKRGDNCILAEHLDADGQPDKDIVGFFQNHIIPTSFTEIADLDYVQRRLQDLNPDCLVIYNVV